MYSEPITSPPHPVNHCVKAGPGVVNMVATELKRVRHKLADEAEQEQRNVSVPEDYARPSVIEPDLVDAFRRTFSVQPPPPAPATAPAPAPAITSASTATSSSPPVYTSPIAKPAPYSGSVEDCNGFLLEMQPHLFPMEYSKTYSGFVDHFKEVFGKPSLDSSIGEKLYNLKQGKMSVNEYALQFRTLAARSGRNEQALLTSYRQGLNPRVRLHLAAYEDTVGLERFIQLSICFATRMQSFIEEHQGQSQLNTFLCRPDSVRTSEPATEPMQVESRRLTPAEWQRRLTQNLCLYCGSPGHVISACPTHPPRPMVSAIISTLQTMKPLTTTVTLAAADVSIPVSALLDSGSAGNFISGALCRQLGLKTKNTPSTYQIHSITGKPVSRRHVSRSIGPLQLQVGLLHVEDIHSFRVSPLT
ncbi:Retrotransposon-derived protein PEG10 [Anabarilius grahami]|uniref:Retrotransposon-derived protein PEG10 n=1 Tax=Anabarilius grahami TaxID=495550 RepID=A0A3N0Y9E5_ANAGA|nr:Retrotransposon-derived protein PEG10 [Anabarilius grahami]